MKKMILATVLALVTTATAQAKMYCSVAEESEPNTYNKIIATKEYDFSQASLILHEEAGLQYSVSSDKNGSMSLAVYNPTTKELYAVASAKTKEQILVLAPQLKRMIACFDVNIAAQ